MSPTGFPLEIGEAIIDILASDKDHSALQSCALVCSAFLPICRKHIFNSVRINLSSEASPSPTIQAIQHLLLESPGIANHIRNLVFCTTKSDLGNPLISEPLKQISRLESLHISWRGMSVFESIDWSDNPLHSTILHLLYLPTITRFKLGSTKNFLISDLIPCVNLRSLDFSQWVALAPSTTFPADLPRQSIQLNELSLGSFTSSAPLTQLATRRDGKLAIDFSLLSKIKVVLESPDDIFAAQKLFAHCGMLMDVCFTLVMPSLADILRPFVQTLRKLAVIFIIKNEDDDPLFGLASELEAMRAENVIKSIHIEALVETDHNCSCGDEWGRLDQVLLRPGWPSLKKVSLEIGVYSSREPGSNELEVALWKLPKMQFLKLSTSQAVSFEFKVTSYLTAQSYLSRREIHSFQTISAG